MKNSKNKTNSKNKNLCEYGPRWSCEHFENEGAHYLSGDPHFRKVGHNKSFRCRRWICVQMMD